MHIKHYTILEDLVVFLSQYHQHILIHCWVDCSSYKLPLEIVRHLHSVFLYLLSVCNHLVKAEL